MRSPSRRRGPRGRLPWFLGLQLLAAVAVVYAVLARAALPILITTVLLVTVLGAVLGTAFGDSQERSVSVGRSLGEGLRRLGRALWP